VPTLVYDVALGDVVRCRANPRRDALDAEAVIRRGGHRTLRLQADADEVIVQAARRAEAGGALFAEWAPDGGASFDVPGSVDVARLERLVALPGVSVHLGPDGSQGPPPARYR
jgi:hypothetical protein